MLIREIRVEDAGKFADLMKNIEAEADYMLMEPGERKTTVEGQRKQLEQFEKQSNSTIFVIEKEEELIGFLLVRGGNARRTKHSGYIVVGILKEYCGRGLGTQLFERLEAWAKEHNILRLELSVVTQNEVGLSLYKKMGFEIEGTKRNSLIINNEFFHEHFMAKLL